MQSVASVAAIRTHSSAMDGIWIPDNRDGTFKNPVLCADYSDPDVVCVGEDFYLTASSFNCAPGLPILHSRDLVNWTLIGHALSKLPHPRYEEVQHGCGVWAPAMRFHAGKFWIFFPMPDEGIYVTTAVNPAGPWGEPHLLQAGKGLIDPCPLWDEDGKAYLVHAWAKSRSGINSILTIRAMSPDGTKLLDDGRIVFDGNSHHPIIEGPKLYKRNGFYYIFAPAGGVATGWQTVLRSKNIFGPYEDKIVLAQGKTDINGPHQGAWVETPAGENWFLHFQDRGAYGRIIHLQPMHWINDWPVIGNETDRAGKGQPVLMARKPKTAEKSHPILTPQTSDEFAGDCLGLQWQWNANPRSEWFSLTERTNWLRLFSIPVPEKASNLWPIPNLLLQKFPALEFTVTTKMNFSQLNVGGKAGLIMMGMDYSYLAVNKTASGFQLLKASCRDAASDKPESSENELPLSQDTIMFRVTVRNGGFCEFSYSIEGEKFLPIGRAFSAREGKWIGAKVGLFCLSAKPGKLGYADFDSFRVEP